MTQVRVRLTRSTAKASVDKLTLASGPSRSKHSEKTSKLCKISSVMRKTSFKDCFRVFSRRQYISLLHESVACLPPPFLLAIHVLQNTLDKSAKEWTNQPEQSHETSLSGLLHGQRHSQMCRRNTPRRHPVRHLERLRNSIKELAKPSCCWIGCSDRRLHSNENCV